MHIHRIQRSVALLMVATFLCLSLFMLLGLSPSRNDPFHSPYIDGKVYTVEAHSDTWFHFDYGFVGPPRTVVTLALANGAKSGLGFEVYAPEFVARWWQVPPTGRGMVLSVDCSTGAIVGGGQCQSKDLLWIGAFGSVGTYYVRVTNNNSTPSQFALTVQGTSVSPAPAPVVVSVPTSTRTLTRAAQAPTRGRTVARQAAVPTSTPTVAAFPTPYDDPYHAVPIDGQWHTLPANSAIWYKFDYGIAGNFQFRPQIGFRLVGAAGTGLGFEIWDSKDLSEWWLKKPVGHGTLEESLTCACQRGPTQTPFPSDQDTPTPTPTSTPGPTETAVPEAICTHTPTNNLTWFGAFGGPGTFYVRVVNKSPYILNYLLVYL